MTTCVPVRDLKNTAAFSDLVQRERNVTVTKNGYCAFHCLSDEEYSLMQEEVSKSRLLSRVLIAEEEIANQEFETYESFSSKLKQEYGI